MKLVLTVFVFTLMFAIVHGAGELDHNSLETIRLNDALIHARNQWQGAEKRYKQFDKEWKAARKNYDNNHELLQCVLRTIERTTDAHELESLREQEQILRHDRDGSYDDIQRIRALMQVASNSMTQYRREMDSIRREMAELIGRATYVPIRVPFRGDLKRHILSNDCMCECECKCECNCDSKNKHCDCNCPCHCDCKCP